MNHNSMKLLILLHIRAELLFTLQYEIPCTCLQQSKVKAYSYLYLQTQSRQSSHSFFTFLFLPVFKRLSRQSREFTSCFWQSKEDKVRINLIFLGKQSTQTKQRIIFFNQQSRRTFLLVFTKQSRQSRELIFMLLAKQSRQSKDLFLIVFKKAKQAKQRLILLAFSKAKYTGFSLNAILGAWKNPH